MDCGYEQQDTQVGTTHDEAKFHHKFVQGIDLKFPACEKQKKKKKNEKTHAKEKNHTHKTIFTQFENLQFVYVHGVVRISLLSGKNTKCCYSVSVSQKTTTMTTIKP